jgi:hypothetical protein
MSGAGFVEYHFRHAVGGFFEFPTENARRILPPSLQPIEPHHGQSVLSVMAFDFHKSMVGEYGEIILSVLVAPRLEKHRTIPRSAFYPFLLGTTTKASREHAIERWHLPHFMDDVDLEFRADAHHLDIVTAYKGAPIINMRVTDYEWEQVEHTRHVGELYGDHRDERAVQRERRGTRHDRDLRSRVHVGD